MHTPRQLFTVMCKKSQSVSHWLHPKFVLYFKLLESRYSRVMECLFHYPSTIGVSRSPSLGIAFSLLFSKPVKSSLYTLSNRWVSITRFPHCFLYEYDLVLIPSVSCRILSPLIFSQILNQISKIHNMKSEAFMSFMKFIKRSTTLHIQKSNSKFCGNFVKIYFDFIRKIHEKMGNLKYYYISLKK